MVESNGERLPLSFAPAIALIYSSASETASTFGVQTLTITGSNFGPTGTVLENALYGDGDGYSLRLNTSQCVLTRPHVQWECRTSAGAGTGLFEGLFCKRARETVYNTQTHPREVQSRE